MNPEYHFLYTIYAYAGIERKITTTNKTNKFVKVHTYISDEEYHKLITRHCHACLIVSESAIF